LIQRICEVDPLIGPECMGRMRIISFIEDLGVVEKILKNAGLWETRNHDPPPQPACHIPEPIYEDTCSQLPHGDYWLAVAERGVLAQRGLLRRNSGERPLDFGEVACQAPHRITHVSMTMRLRRITHKVGHNIRCQIFP